MSDPAEPPNPDQDPSVPAQDTTVGNAPAPRGGVNPVVIVVAVVAVVVVGLVALLATSGGDKEADSADQVVSDEAPELVGQTVSGDAFDIADLQGSWVFVNFFATWCPPCVAEHGELIALSEDSAADVQVVSVAFDEPEPVISDFFETNGGDWPVVTESEGIPLDWGVIGLPESFLISPDGEVVEKYKGGVTAAGIEQDIAEHS